MLPTWALRCKFDRILWVMRLLGRATECLRSSPHVSEMTALGSPVGLSAAFPHGKETTSEGLPSGLLCASHFSSLEGLFLRVVTFCREPFQNRAIRPSVGAPRLEVTMVAPLPMGWRGGFPCHLLRGPLIGRGCVRSHRLAWSAAVHVTCTNHEPRSAGSPPRGSHAGGVLHAEPSHQESRPCRIPRDGSCRAFGFGDCRHFGRAPQRPAAPIATGTEPAGVGARPGCRVFGGAQPSRFSRAPD